MSVVATPPQDELELLIREARARQRRRRILLAAAVAVAAAGILVAFSTMTGGSSAKAHGAGGGVAASPLARCRTDQLRLTSPRGLVGAAAGSVYDYLTVVNGSSSSCAVGGWPRVRWFDRAGAPLPEQVYRWVYKQRGPAPFRMVPLRPGAAATFDLVGSDSNHAADGGPCPYARTIEVQPRAGGAWLSIRHTVPACRGWDIAPFVPGHVADPPNFALSLFYVPPTPGRPYYSGRESGTSWELHARDSGDGRYCFTVVTNGTSRGSKCGRIFGQTEPGKLGWIASSRGSSFVAGAVVSTATHMGINLSNGSVLYPRTMRPTLPLAPGISFFFATIPHGTHPVSIRGRTDTGGHVVEWPPEQT